MHNVEVKLHDVQVKLHNDPSIQGKKGLALKEKFLLSDVSPVTLIAEDEVTSTL